MNAWTWISIASQIGGFALFVAMGFLWASTQSKLNAAKACFFCGSRETYAQLSHQLEGPHIHACPAHEDQAAELFRKGGVGFYGHYKLKPGEESPIKIIESPIKVIRSK